MDSAEAIEEAKVYGAKGLTMSRRAARHLIGYIEWLESEAGVDGGSHRSLSFEWLPGDKD